MATKDQSNPNRVEHQGIAQADVFKGSGTEASYALPNPPIVSVSPTSQPQGFQRKGWGSGNNNLMIIDKPNMFLGQDTTGDKYSFFKLETGQGLFIPVGDHGTTDALLEEIYKQIAMTKKKYGVAERDENGDEILEQCTVQVRKRQDGPMKLLQLENGKPIIGANFVQLPRYAYSPSFVAKAVVKDDEIGDSQSAPSDGVLVIRHT